ncbi:MAG: HesA/MoeB/ThiF family protein [Ignavibacteria bacterium]|nr:HesA/MoeB/ThiF family protein [Ignavibacteria bacterium]
MNPKLFYQRYGRQILLKQFGEAAQLKLLNSRVLVIGAGGLGCPALQYLAAAGVGTIGIIDYDVVDISNLQRQILFATDDIGKSKAETASKKLRALNPGIEIQAFDLKLDNQNAFKIISEYEIVIDGTDNFSTRYLVNDACVLLDKPLIYGAVLRFEGQVGVFNYAERRTGVKTNYRDLFPKAPDANSVLSCNEAGVLGVVPGIIGTMQAAEAIKIITGTGEVLCNAIVSYNVLTNTFHKFTISESNQSKSLIPKSESEFLNFDYDWFCGIRKLENEISVEEFDELISKEKIRVIDVREKKELHLASEFTFEQIPMSEFEENISALDSTDTIVLICQTGNRSLKAVEIIKEKIKACKAFSLTGGIEAWRKHHLKV